MLSHHGGRFLGEPGWWPFFTGIIPLILWLALLGLVVWAVIRLTRGGGPAGRPHRDEAVEELRRRYARGEVTRDEFIERSRDLGGSGSPAS
jgi:putative membrane protein